jgi:hypothetical protein
MPKDIPPVDADLELLIHEARNGQIAPDLREAGQRYAFHRTRDCIHSYELFDQTSEAIPLRWQAHMETCRRCRTVVSSRVPAEKVAAAIEVAAAAAIAAVERRNRGIALSLAAATAVLTAAGLLARNMRRQSTSFSTRVKKAIGVTSRRVGARFRPTPARTSVV